MVKERREKVGPHLTESENKPVIMDVVPGVAFQPFAHLDGLNGPAATQVQIPSVGAIVLQVCRLSPCDLIWPKGQTIILFGTACHRPPENPVGLAVMTPSQRPPLLRATLNITNDERQEEVKLLIRPPQKGSRRSSTIFGHEGPVVMLGKHLQGLSVTITDLSTNV